MNSFKANRNLKNDKCDFTTKRANFQNDKLNNDKLQDNEHSEKANLKNDKINDKFFELKKGRSEP